MKISFAISHLTNTQHAIIFDVLNMVLRICSFYSVDFAFYVIHLNSERLVLKMIVDCQLFAMGIVTASLQQLHNFVYSTFWLSVNLIYSWWFIRWQM